MSSVAYVNLKPIRRMLARAIILSVIGGLCITMPAWAAPSAKQTISLNGNDWVIYSGLPNDSNGITTTTGTVPGNIQSDLERQHLLEPLSYGAGDPRLVKVCQKDWWYKKSFAAPSDFSGQRIMLVFDGVDWSCQVWLNEQLLGSHAGMFRRFEFDISKVVRPGQTNTLVVKLDKMPDELLPYLIGSDGKGSGEGTEYYFSYAIAKTRQKLKDIKTSTNFGWDWGTNIWTLGIWKDVCIEATGPARIEWVQVQSHLSDNYKNADVSVKLEINSSTNIGAARAKFRLTGNGADIQSVTDISLSDGNNVVSGQIKLADPALWWPNGQGEQPLYIVESSLEKADGTIIDTKSTRFGIREIKWSQVTGAPADFINPYRLYVNGRPVRMLGCNLAPPDLLPGNIMARCPKLMQLAHDAHINTLRMWGGGVLPEEMFDLADELGLMLSQEFPMAGSLPESDEVFLKNLDCTIRNIVKQARNHPCIIEWDGGNEMGFYQGMDHPALHVLERVTAQEDDRIFRATDPMQGGRHGPYTYVSSAHYTHWNDPNIKPNTGDFPMMRAGEFSAQSPTNLEVWYRDVPLPSQWPIIPQRDCNDPTLIRKNILHGWGLNNWLAKGTIDSLFGKAKNLDDMVQGGQFIGAEGIRSASDALRRRGSTLGGMTTWVLNEPWPNGAGSFHVDYDGVPLMNYYWLTEALEPVSISLKYNSITYSQTKGIDTELWVVSDLPRTTDSLNWKYTVRTSDGAVVDRGDGNVKIAPQECLKVRDIHINPPTNLGTVFVELQLCDSSNAILTERMHVFGLDGVAGVFGGLLNNSTSDGNVPEVPSSPANFAYVGNGASPATASSTIPAEVMSVWEPDIHVYKAEYINDGRYGANGVWIGNKNIPGYIPMPYFQIDLGKVHTVGRFKIGRDRAVTVGDRPLSYLKIESSLDAKTWTSIFEKSNIQAIAGYSPVRTLEIATQPAEAQYLKVTVGEGGAGVDEFEVYAPRMPLPAQLPAISMTDLPTWAVPVKKTSLTAAMSALPQSEGKEVAKITLTNTGQMTALFCQLKPMLAYRTDLFLSNNFIFVPPGQSREIIVKSSANPVCGLTLLQTGWRVYSWNADDVVINPSDKVLFSFGRADSMCREYKGYADANKDPLGRYAATVSGAQPDASVIPWIVTTQSKLTCSVNVSKASVKRSTRLYICTADQSYSVPATLTASVNGVKFTSLLPTGLGKQNTVPYHLGYPYTAKIDIPAGTFKKGDNVLEISSENGWFTWDACYLITTENIH